MDIAWTPIVAAAVANFVIGMLWYSPLLFGKAWMKEAGVSEADMKKCKGMRMAVTFLTSFVTSLVMAYVLLKFIGMSGMTGWQGGAEVGAWIWLGFFATSMVGSILWEGKSSKYYAINVAYCLASLLAMGAVLGHLM